MRTILIEPITPVDENLWQIINFEARFGEQAKRVSLELMYAEEPDVWYMTLKDLQTDAVYFRMVPLLASYGEINNLWEPFRYKEIGIFYCVPKSDNPSTENPSKDTLDEFYLIWGDGLG